ncbi:S8/S53 family peptidase [Actinocorallia aurantiaca]|uniref:S8/S53 family peptidase n=1 Tax=Actinocorallia aurantiaca TaxID=46204 RepID=UPI0031E2B8A3
MRVAVVEHPAGISGALARTLRTYVARIATSRVDVDPGYWLEPAARVARSAVNPPVPKWTTLWNEERQAVVRGFPRPRLPVSVAGAHGAESLKQPTRVLLLDTGDLRAVRQEIFLLGQSDRPDDPPPDWHGHGTSLGDVIRLRAPKAIVTALRIYEPEARYCASATLLAALTWALHHFAGADVVCVAQRAVITEPHASHVEVLERILGHAVAHKLTAPIVVCAAGNSPGGRELMALPAIMPGVVTARAIGWSGNVLPYNCRLPRDQRVDIVDAYGGEESDPIGVTADPGHGAVRMVGSSYAAALVTGALAAG